MMYLVGTVHGDPKGPETLMTLLEKLSPTMICVEAEPSAIIQYPQTKTRLKKAIAECSSEYGPLFIEKYALQHYELETALQYRNYHAVPLFGVDKRTNDHGIATWQDFAPIFRADKNKRETILREFTEEFTPDREWIETLYRSYYYFADDGELNEKYNLVTEEEEPRDKHMAAQIENIYTNEDCLVHIGGLVHIMHGQRYKTVFTLLEKYHPVRIPLR